MNASRYQRWHSFAQDLQRLFPGLTVKYTAYYYRLTNRFTDDDQIIFLQQAAGTPARDMRTQITLARHHCWSRPC